MTPGPRLCQRGVERSLRSYVGASVSIQTGTARNHTARSCTNAPVNGSPAVIDQVHREIATPDAQRSDVAGHEQPTVFGAL